MSTEVNTDKKYTSSNPCCFLNLTKGIQCVAGIQITHGILYLVYSIISWPISSFPRVKSSFETYYAFGQPVLIAILGLILLITIIAVSDFNAKAAISTCWFVTCIVLVGITAYRLTRFFEDDLYIATLAKHKNVTITETIVSVLFIMAYVYEMAVVISYLCEKSKEEEAEANDISRIKSGELQIKTMMPRQPIFIQANPYQTNQLYNPVYPQQYYAPRYFYNDTATDLLVLGMLAGAGNYSYGCYDQCYW